MIQGGFRNFLRKSRQRKCPLMFLFCFLIFLHGLLKRRSEDDRTFHMSRSRREELLNIAPRQRLRRQRIEHHCANRPTNDIMPAGSQTAGVPRHVFRHIIVNDKYRFLYCQVPKVATSNWKRVFMVLDGNATNPWHITSSDVHNKTRGYFRYLNEYTPSEILVRLKTYYKFLFVRQPFERLTSAYRNKFVESYNMTFFARIYGRYIIRRFRKRENFQETKISFPEFVRYILESGDEVMDNHWRLYDELCRPCLIFYNFIGYFRQLGRDSRDVLRILGVSDKVSFPMNISSNYKVPSSVLTRKYFSELQRDEKERLYKKYQYDFEMFGYKFRRN